MGTHSGMVVCEGIIDRHVFEKPTDLLVEETLDFCEIIFRVDEDGTDVSFDNIR